MASAILNAIDAIFTIIERVQLISDLAANNATSVITIADLVSIVNGANARLFTTIGLADIRRLDERFRAVWLPDVLAHGNRGEITANHLAPGTGTLHSTFTDVTREIDTLDVNLNRLRAVFEQNHAHLHLDELVSGFYAFVQGYGLLLHMHAVRSELDRIAIRAASLDDPGLLKNTLKTLVFLNDGIGSLTWFPNPIWTRREAFIGPLRLTSMGAINSYYTFHDNYRPLSSTASERALWNGPFNAGTSAHHHAIQRRNQHIADMRARVNSIVHGPGAELVEKFEQLATAMRERERKQNPRGARTIIKRRGLTRLGSGDGEEELVLEKSSWEKANATPGGEAPGQDTAAEEGSVQGHDSNPFDEEYEKIVPLPELKEPIPPVEESESDVTASGAEI